MAQETNPNPETTATRGMTPGQQQSQQQGGAAATQTAGQGTADARSQTGLFIHEVLKWVNNYIGERGPIELAIDNGREVKVLEMVQEAGGLRLRVTGIDTPAATSSVELKPAYVSQLLDAIFQR